MDYRVNEWNNVPYLEIDGIIISEQDAVDVVGACGESGASRVLLESANLPAEFTNLKSGLAGQMLLKFSMYGVKTAAVLSQEQIGSGKFYEMVLETNRGDQFRVYTDRQAALDWLTQ